MMHFHFRYTSRFKSVLSIDFEMSSNYQYMVGYPPGHPAIVQIGIKAINTEVLLYNCNNVSWSSFGTLVNPGPFYTGFYWEPEGGYRTNGGVSINQVAESKTLDTIWPDLLRWVEATCEPPTCLVAYGGLVADFKLLQDEIGRYNLKKLEETSLGDQVWFVDSKRVIDSLEGRYEGWIRNKTNGNYIFTLMTKMDTHWCDDNTVLHCYTFHIP